MFVLYYLVDHIIIDLELIIQRNKQLRRNFYKSPLYFNEINSILSLCFDYMQYSFRYKNLLKVFLIGFKK